uniref:Early E1A protein n=1 Tax=Human adenovirus C108 TaxID=3088344 RepID=A0AAF0Z002_9ADEN|nr:E1A 26 kDa protein [Human mastadenovirus C]WPC85853.1 control protein E1A 243R [Human adenovirus C108]
MRHIICHGGVITEEMAASLLEQLIEEVLADNLPPPSHFEPPTLHELYDLDVTAPEDPNEEAVSQIFPESVMLAVQEGIDLFTFPPAPGSPEPPHLSRQPEQSEQRALGPVSMPNLVPEVIDLTCHEAGFPPSDDEDEEGPVSEPEPEPEPEPARPTRRPKMVPAILRRPTSPVSRECNSSTDSCDSGPSNTPPEIHPVVPLCPIKPVAVRVGGRRQAVECIEDLLNEPGQPLDLSCKRPRP